MLLFTAIKNLSWYQSHSVTNVMTTASSSALPQSTISDIPSLSEITLPNYNFPFKLEHDNYVIWKSQIHPAIVGCNMESFIDGTTLPPSSTMTETNIENG